MKKVLAILYLASIYSVCFVATTNIAYAGGEMKEVCHDKLDKAGKPVMKDCKSVQACKKIKVHKKLEGTEIPVKK
jgi:hypothetical protein